MKQRHTFVVAIATFLCLSVISSAAGTVSLPAPFFYGSIADNNTTTTVITNPGGYTQGHISASVFATPNAGSSLFDGCDFS